MNYFDTYLAEHAQLAQRIDRTAVDNAVNLLYELRKHNGRLFIVGNGGSAANASHAVNDFRKIAHIQAYAPSDNIAELTAWANDIGFDVVYQKWLAESCILSNDTLLVLSVGGGTPTTSRNLMSAMGYADSMDCPIISIVGRDGGIAKELSAVCILVPTVNENTITPHVEDWQLLLIHYLTKELNHRL